MHFGYCLGLYCNKHDASAYYRNYDHLSQCGHLKHETLCASKKQRIVYYISFLFFFKTPLCFFHGHNLIIQLTNNWRENAPSPISVSRVTQWRWPQCFSWQSVFVTRDTSDTDFSIRIDCLEYFHIQIIQLTNNWRENAPSPISVSRVTQWSWPQCFSCQSVHF